MPSPYLSEPVVIVNPAQVATPYGGTRTQPDWQNAERITATGFISQRGVSDELAGNARTADGAKWGLVLNGDPPITQDSRVEYRGEVFRVSVRPKRVGVRGVIRHVEVTLIPLGEV